MKCLMCQKNKHGECIRHINDDCYDAEDFDSTALNCKCPCDGEVPMGGKLISLVQELREEIERRDTKIKEANESLRKVERARHDFLHACHRFFAEYIDDEGELLSVSKTRNWENGLGKLYKEYLKAFGSPVVDDGMNEFVDVDDDDDDFSPAIGDIEE